MYVNFLPVGLLFRNLSGVTLRPAAGSYLSGREIRVVQVVELLAGEAFPDYFALSRALEPAAGLAAGAGAVARRYTLPSGTPVAPFNPSVSGPSATLRFSDGNLLVRSSNATNATAIVNRSVYGATARAVWSFQVRWPRPLQHASRSRQAPKCMSRTIGACFPPHAARVLRLFG
jgi:hypothetical protein